ncbi:MAG: hypothetical protein JW829_20330 [Pirellulales bacterium]|nr:hypothetical protein [Pirellulales bacterium]
MIQKTILLGDLATALSSRWNNHLNLGVVAFTETNYQFLVRELTVAHIREYFASLNATRVDRFELPNVWALNFLFYDIFSDPARALWIENKSMLLGTAAVQIQLPCLNHS